MKSLAVLHLGRTLSQRKPWARLTNRLCVLPIARQGRAHGLLSMLRACFANTLRRFATLRAVPVGCRAALLAAGAWLLTELPSLAVVYTDDPEVLGPLPRDLLSAGPEFSFTALLLFALIGRVGDSNAYLSIRLAFRSPWAALGCR